jgi:F-type H+-transporting ATPase subunit a
MFCLANPLEQFQLVPLIPLRSGRIDISFTNSGLFMVWGMAVFFLVVYLSTLNGGGTIVPNRWQILVEGIYTTVMDFVMSNIGPLGTRYFPFVFSIFTFILAMNLIGMVPYSFTVTSHLIVTLALSTMVFFGRTYIMVRLHGIKALAVVLPPGLPIALVPLLVMIETVGYFMTNVSLPVRLFANMMRGHIMLKVLIGFAWTIITAGRVALFIAHIFPLGIVFLLVGMELGIAFIQAYVFAVLTCIYIQQAHELH